MAKKPTVREQVKSGFRTAGTMILVFAFFTALTISTSFLIGRREAESTSTHRLHGGLSIVLLGTAMFLATRFWAKWLVSILAYCFVKSLALLLFLPRAKPLTVLCTIMFLLMACVLTFRYINKKPVGAERLGLVFFVACVPFAMDYHS